MKASTSEFQTIHGLRYHVRTWGDARAPRIFLLHGWMDVSASFQFFVDALKQDWHIVAPDWRGFGLSGWARHGYWFPDYYADLEALLDIYSADTPATVIGHSMGGNIACTYAGLRPQRIAKLATLEGIGMPRTDPATAPERLVKWLDAHVKSPRFRDYASFDDVAERLKRNNPRLPNEKAQFLARHWARENGAGGIEMLSDPRHRAANPYLFRVEEALACWRRITAPALLVSGKDSHIIAWLKDVPEEVAERKKAFRNLRDVVLEDCGHMMHHDQPERLAAVVEEFITPP